MPPLITIETVVEGTKALGLYDPGANITMISHDFLKKLNKKMFESHNLRFRTMSGEDKILGTVSLKTKIFNIQKEKRMFVIDRKDFKYDILIGLDSIYEFKLEQDCHGKISQVIREEENKRENVNEIERVEEDDKERNENEIEKDRNMNEEILVNWNESIPVEQFNMKVNHLDERKKKIIYDLVDEYGSVFAKHQFDIGTVNDHEACIKLSEDRYVAKKPYRCSIEDQDEIERQVAELLKYGLIEESCSPFSAPVTLAYKKTGDGGLKEKTRMCIDFRELNKLIVPESTPFPVIDDIITKTRGCSWFSALDINSAFWSIPIRKKDRYKTGFVTQQGQYQWSSLPFGLRTSSAVFQRILAGIIRRNNLRGFCCNYIDDILIFSKNFEEHLQHLRALIEAIMKEGFRLKFVKCNFAQRKVQYLGHVIEENSVCPMKDNLVAIKNFPVPKNKKNIRQFLGKINFYHKYIPQATRTLEPFHRLLRKDASFEWSEECQSTFEKLKSYLVSAPVLAIFDPERPTTLYSDASIVGVGAVLKQTQPNGDEKPVAYFSKKLSEAQKKRKAIYIELLAVLEAIKYWRFWLIGRKFKVVTDHKPLANMNLRARTDEELGDISNYLLQYDFQIEYRPGENNGEADCLSRNPVLDWEEGKEDAEPLRTVNTLTIEEILNGQKNVELRDKDEIKHGVIVRKIKKNERIVLNEEAGNKIIKTIHDRFGHIGASQMITLLVKQFYFPNMHKKIIEHCINCEVCIKNKSRRGRGIGLMGQLGPASHPFEIMSMDTIGGFAGRRSTKKYLHVLVDHFTRYVYTLTSKNQNATEFIKLVDKVQRENPIETLLTDQYGGLSANEFEDYLKEKGITHIFTAVDHAASNGLNERTGQTLVNRIRCRSNENEGRIAWCAVAGRCVKEYNETVHSSTGFAPNYLLNGVKTELVPQEFIQPSNLLEDRKLALERSNRAHERNKKYFDKNKISGFFDIGEQIYVENGNKLNRKKLDEIRVGPYTVVRKLSETVYEIDTGGKKHNRRLYHSSKMVKIKESENTLADIR